MFYQAGTWRREDTGLVPGARGGGGRRGRERVPGMARKQGRKVTLGPHFEGPLRTEFACCRQQRGVGVWTCRRHRVCWEAVGDNSGGRRPFLPRVPSECRLISLPRCPLAPTITSPCPCRFEQSHGASC